MVTVDLITGHGRVSKQILQELTKCGSANLAGELGNLCHEDIEILILIFTFTISKSC